MTLEALLARRAKLEDIVAKGVVRTRFEDSEVEYRSMADLERALAAINSQIAELENTANPRIFSINAGRGL